MPILIVIIWIDQKRTFYRFLDNDITVWKCLGDKCYILPYKYYGLTAPDEDYISTSNGNTLNLIFEGDTSNNSYRIIVSGIDPYQIVSKSKIIDSKNIQNFNSIYTYMEGHYRYYKKSVNFISFNIKELSANDKNGRLKSN